MITLTAPSVSLAGKSQALEDRICDRFEVDQETGCWVWIGTRWSRNGYGRIYFGGKERAAHVVVYLLLRGPYGRGLVLDHAVCQNRACVNPAHLEPVSVKENTHRGRAVLFGPGGLLRPGWRPSK